MTVARSVRIMGIVNVTPDSFSDGGSFLDAAAAVNQARILIDQGADVIDIGGESTRPYAEPVSLKAELGRVIPVIKGIRAFSDIAISIDTSKAEVASQALAAGANIINDVTALRKDPEMVEVVSNTSGEVIIMHMQGTPGTMQDDPHYRDVVAEVISFFRERLEFIGDSGIDRLVAGRCDDGTFGLCRISPSLSPRPATGQLASFAGRRRISPLWPFWKCPACGF